MRLNSSRSPWFLALAALSALGPAPVQAETGGPESPQAADVQGEELPSPEGGQEGASLDLLDETVPLSEEALNLAIEHGMNVRERRASLAHLRRSRPLSRSGALSGKRIVLSPGHGIHAHVSNHASWAWARSAVHDLREDKHTYEWVHDFVQPMLERAGAETLMARANGYNETFTEVKLADAILTGAWTDAGGYRQAASDSTGASVARWPFKVAETGDHPVYVRFKSTSSGAPDAAYEVSHAFGKTSFILDHHDRRLNGPAMGTDANPGVNATGADSKKDYSDVWHYVGTYPFRQGETYAVELSSKGSSPGKVVVAGHVFVGEGPGSVLSNQASSPKVSGHYRWQESSSYFLKWRGMANAMTFSDYYCRPLYALYEGADAFFALHSNAAGSSNSGARGTETYVYAPLDRASYSLSSSWSASDKAALPPGSLEFADGLHNSFVDYVAAYYDGKWPERRTRTVKGLKAGELSVTYAAWYNHRTDPDALAIPTALMETAFHDEANDAAAIKEQEFRFIGARGILAGFIHYFKGADAMIPPLPPSRLSAVADGCAVNVAWSPVQDKVNGNSKPSKYNVYVSKDGVLFDRTPAATVTDAKATLPIARGETLYVKVTAVNDAGESMDSMVAAARLASPGSKRVLFVDGVDRERKTVNDPNGVRSYARIYGPAATLNDPGYGLATVDDEAAASFLDGRSFDAVVWATGTTSDKTDVLPKEQRDVLASLRSSGTPLVISGAEIGHALANASYNGDPSFLADRFGAAYASDDSGDHTVKGFPGIPDTLTFGPAAADGGKASARTMDAAYIQYPDVLTAKGGGTVLVTYAGKGTAAAVLSSDKRAVLAGFPLESIADAKARRCAIANLLATVMGTSVNSACDQASYQKVAEICGNGQDDDCNGRADCDDGACAADVSCQPVVVQEICDNGKDDDGDGAVDCKDSDCLGHAHCADAGAPETDAGMADGGGTGDAGSSQPPISGEQDAGASLDPSADGLGSGMITIETGCSAAASPSLAALFSLFPAFRRRRRA